MKLKLTIICLLLGTGLFSSCIREETLNTEADIESVTLAGDVMNRSAEFGDAITTPSGGLIYPVTLYVKKGTDVTVWLPN